MFADQLWRAVDGLTPPDNELLRRFYYEGEPIRVIARDLGLTPGAAKTRLCRARKVLKEQLTRGGAANGSHA